MQRTAHTECKPTAHAHVCCSTRGAARRADGSTCGACADARADARADAPHRTWSTQLAPQRWPLLAALSDAAGSICSDMDAGAAAWCPTAVLSSGCGGGGSADLAPNLSAWPAPPVATTDTATALAATSSALLVVLVLVLLVLAVLLQLLLSAVADALSASMSAAWTPMGPRPARTAQRSARHADPQQPGRCDGGMLALTASVADARELSMCATRCQQRAHVHACT